MSSMTAWKNIMKKCLTNRWNIWKKNTAMIQKLSYSVEKKTKLSDSKLKDIRKDLEDNYDADVKVTKGYKVKVEMTIKGDDDDDEDTTTFTVAKVDGDWVLVDGGLF